MGVPDIKYGDSVCYIQHVDTCLWLTYQTVDAKCARMGGVQRKVPNCIKPYCTFQNFITRPSFLVLQSMLGLLYTKELTRCDNKSGSRLRS